MKTKDLLLVIIQFTLLIIFFLIPAGYAMNIYYQVIAFVLTVTGIIIFFIAIGQLGSALTPMPTPKHKGMLVTNGIYKVIRHPLYSGIILVVLGISIYSLSIPRFIMAIIIFIFFEYKSRYEESLLIQTYPEYNEYKKTTGRFFPKLNKYQSK